ncbi:hypothetical protein HN51_032036 [Arachis hypogaea]
MIWLGESTIELHYLPVYEETYKSLKSKGIRFPGHHNESLAPIFTPPHSVFEVELDLPCQTQHDDIPVQSFTPEQTKKAFDVARNSIELLSIVLSSIQQDVLQVSLVPGFIQKLLNHWLSLRNIQIYLKTDKLHLLLNLRLQKQEACRLKKARSLLRMKTLTMRMEKSNIQRHRRSIMERNEARKRFVRSVSTPAILERFISLEKEILQIKSSVQANALLMSSASSDEGMTRSCNFKHVLQIFL